MQTKYKHGQRVISYTASDYSKYHHAESYIHPTLTITRAKIIDAMEEFRTYGSDCYLEKAKLLREHTGNTFYVDLISGFSQTITFKWQADRRYHNSEGYYSSLYGCKIDHCGFDLDCLSIATKIAKIATEEWSEHPLRIVEALKQMKAICSKYDKPTDSHLVSDHLDDNMFGLPIEQRQPVGVEA